MWPPIIDSYAPISAINLVEIDLSLRFNIEVGFTIVSLIKSSALRSTSIVTITNRKELIIARKINITLLIILIFIKNKERAKMAARKITPVIDEDKIIIENDAINRRKKLNLEILFSLINTIDTKKKKAPIPAKKLGSAMRPWKPLSESPSSNFIILTNGETILI